MVPIVRRAAGAARVLPEVGLPRSTGARRAIKDVTDRLLAAVLLLPAVPVLLVAGLLVKLSGPGPVLYRQTRVGRDGVEFAMWKLRTMRVGADGEHAGLRGGAVHDDAVIKLPRDPRVTSLGGLLRRYSVDELPQLVNVLTGSMSLVGPRPLLPDEVVRFGDVARRRLVVKPGMTGLWQVSGRSDLTWAEQLRLDVHYVENWSLRLDLRILVRTAGAVLSTRGAY
jgi:lipopolysaccharide/colanic/teichoic acid biosynthesis glycosyltransferase